MNARITSFATYQDLVNYIKCLQGGKSTRTCYSYGDNGVGASGRVTAQIHTPMCALPPSELRRKWGTTKAAWGKRVKVTLRGKCVICEVADIGPAGVCDLNPASLIGLCLSQDAEISENGSWEWV